MVFSLLPRAVTATIAGVLACASTTSAAAVTALADTTKPTPAIATPSVVDRTAAPFSVQLASLPGASLTGVSLPGASLSGVSLPGTVPATAGSRAAVPPPGGLTPLTVTERRAAGPLVVLPSGPLAIPGAAYAAYRKAATRAATDLPGCGVPWSLLAAIGRIESGHAGGGAVDATGYTLTAILGPILDGSLAGNAVIVDADGGQLDGSITHERAVGPMQFLPGTWQIYGADNSGDGVADPNNVFDATYAAARLLCASGPLTTDAGQRRAVFAYNHSAPYVDNVLAWSRAYALNAVPVGGIPEMTIAPRPTLPAPRPQPRAVVIVSCPSSTPPRVSPSSGKPSATAIRSAPAGSSTPQVTTTPTQNARPSGRGTRATATTTTTTTTTQPCAPPSSTPPSSVPRSGPPRSAAPRSAAPRSAAPRSPAPRSAPSRSAPRSAAPRSTPPRPARSSMPTPARRSNTPSTPVTTTTTPPPPR